jgi:hypothetical protein
MKDENHPVSLEERVLERALAAGDPILPSSGFTASVMDAVRAEASGPPPIPFPWKRAWPGLVAAVLALGIAVAAVVAAIPALRTAPAAGVSDPWGFVVPMLQGMLSAGTEWTVGGLILGGVSIWFSLRLGVGARR